MSEKPFDFLDWPMSSSLELGYNFSISILKFIKKNYQPSNELGSLSLQDNQTNLCSQFFDVSRISQDQAPLQRERLKKDLPIIRSKFLINFIQLHSHP